LEGDFKENLVKDAEYDIAKTKWPVNKCIETFK
jgi:hypothetical protein